MWVVFVLFKQKTAYEMRISDCSSAVCSSDLWSRDCLPQGGKERFEQPDSIRVERIAGNAGLADCAFRLGITRSQQRADQGVQFIEFSFEFQLCSDGAGLVAHAVQRLLSLLPQQGVQTHFDLFP